MGLTRRAALQAVGAMVGVLYGTTTVANGQKTLMLALDDVGAITLRFRGRTVSVSPAQVVDALSGREPEAQQVTTVIEMDGREVARASAPHLPDGFGRGQL
jgi:acetolactate synthase small subunit